MGDECPGGSASRHSMFLPGPNSVGTLVADDSPLPFGPRKRDQSGASAAVSVTPAIISVSAHSRASPARRTESRRMGNSIN